MKDLVLVTLLIFMNLFLHANKEATAVPASQITFLSDRFKVCFSVLTAKDLSSVAVSGHRSTPKLMTGAGVMGDRGGLCELASHP